MSTFFSIESIGVSHVVAIELLRSKEKLPPVLERTLNELVNSNDFDALKKMSITVDLSAILLTSKLRQEEEQEVLELEKFIARHAHWPLLYRIFGKKITQKEVADIRKRKKIKIPPRRAIFIPEQELFSMWEFWSNVRSKFLIEKDIWFAMSEKFPQYALSVIYRAMIIDSKK